MNLASQAQTPLRKNIQELLMSAAKEQISEQKISLINEDQNFIQPQQNGHFFQIEQESEGRDLEGPQSGLHLLRQIKNIIQRANFQVEKEIKDVIERLKAKKEQEQIHYQKQVKIYENALKSLFENNLLHTLSENQKLPISEQQPKDIAVYPTSPVKFNQKTTEIKTRTSKRWTYRENSIYLKCLDLYPEAFETSNRRKSQIFKRLSKMLQGTKNSHQCRGHHRRLLQTWKSIDKIKNRIKEKIEMEQREAHKNNDENNAESNQENNVESSQNIMEKRLYNFDNLNAKINNSELELLEPYNFGESQFENSRQKYS